MRTAGNWLPRLLVAAPCVRPLAPTRLFCPERKCILALFRHTPLTNSPQAALPVLHGPANFRRAFPLPRVLSSHRDIRAPGNPAPARGKATVTCDASMGGGKVVGQEEGDELGTYPCTCIFTPEPKAALHPFTQP